MARLGNRGASTGFGKEKLSLQGQNLSYYRVLGVSPGAAWKEIQRQYRLLVRQYHPDHNPGDPQAADHFRLLVEAYEAIREDQARPRPAPRKPDIEPTGIKEEHPPSPPPKASEAASSEAALNSLRRAIRESPDFPAFAANVQELMVIKENPYNTINTVSRIILRDLSLTTQILKMINTIFFQTCQRQVQTISSAVMILGLDRIRDLAIGLRLFEHFKSSRSLSAVMQLIAISFLTAMQAQELTSRDSTREPEELFIIALFFNIGELISAFYFPEKYKEILRLTKKEGLNRKAAALEVLKVTMEDLGLAVLRDWNIPQPMLHSLTAIHKSSDEAAAGDAQLRKVVRSAYNLSKNAMDREIAPEVQQKLKDSACRALGVNPATLDKSLEASKKRLQEMAQVLRLDLRKIELGKELTPPDRQKAPPPETAAKEKETPITLQGESRQEAPVSSPKTGLEEAEDVKRLQFLYQVLQEVSQAIVSKVPINQILMTILEGIFRGISFDRVIFFLVNPKRTHIQPRFGLGEGIEELFPLLRAPLHSKTHALSLALAENQDYLLNLESQPGKRHLMEENFWQASGVRSFLINPILVEQKAIGAIYTDRCRSQVPISDTDRQHVRLFRDQMIIAIRLSSSQL